MWVELGQVEGSNVRIVVSDEDEDRVVDNRYSILSPNLPSWLDGGASVVLNVLQGRVCGV